jgi:endonuclease-3 related protein
LENESRLERLVGELKQFYGLLPSPPADAFQMFVWEVLSYQSSPQQRNSAVAALKRNLSLTPDSMSKVAPKKLDESVKLTGSYVEQRLRALKTGITVFQRNPELPATIKGPVAGAQQALAMLPQMADGGADRMLLYSGDHLVFPLEAGIGRVVRRLGYDEAPESELPATLDAYRRACTYLSHHAVATCIEKDPHCTVCPLRPDCPYGQDR